MGLFSAPFLYNFNINNVAANIVILYKYVMIKITNIDDPRISFYQNLRFTPKSHIDQNVFVVEGEKTSKKLLESELDIISFFALSDYYNEYSALLKSKGVGDNFQFYADKELMNKIVGYKLHQGIMAIAKQPEEKALEDLKSPIVVMNGIINSENVGSIIRNAVAFGINSIIYDKDTSNPFLRRAVRVSMGTVFDINYYQSQNLMETLNDLKTKFDYSLIALEISDGAISLNQFQFPEKIAIIFGSEGKGIKDSILKKSDKIVYIPINKNVPSINVAATSAIVFNAIR